MCWNLQKAAVKTVARLLRKYQWFWIQQEAAVNHVTLHVHSIGEVLTRSTPEGSADSYEFIVNPSNS